MVTDVPDGKMVCQLCGGSGTYAELRLVGDGVPGVTTHLDEQVVECDCDDGFIDDPEADRKA